MTEMGGGSFPNGDMNNGSVIPPEVDDAVL